MKKPYDEPAIAWCELNVSPALRFRVFEATDFRCATCGAEEGRTILRRYTQWADPRAWVEFSGDTASRAAWDARTVTVHLVLWASRWPCDEQELQARCMGCVIRADVEACWQRPPTRKRGARAQPRLWE